MGHFYPSLHKATTKLLIFSVEFRLIWSFSVSLTCRRAASSDPGTLRWSTVHLLPQIYIGAACLCVSPAIRSEQSPSPLTLYPLPSVKSPRGPDHGEANMWFELASQKQALHTWGCVCIPRARWSSLACVIYNREYVFVQLIVFVCVLAQTYASFCVCSYVNFGEVPCACVWIVLILQQEARVSSKSAVCVSRDTTKWSKKNLLNFDCVALIHLSSLVDPPHTVIHACVFVHTVSSETYYYNCFCAAVRWKLWLSSMFICTASQEAEREW